MRRILAATLFVAVVATHGLAETRALEPPIQDNKGVRPNATVFKSSSLRKPLVIRSEKDAASYFSMDDVKSLQKQVDFKKQFLLVFAWRGSGRDQLAYDVAESFPEQIQFRYKRGLTKDLRPHVHVFALRANVKWSPPR